MDQRKKLHLMLTAIMTELFGDSASAQVYFQPPETIKLVYPCIIYEREMMTPRFANNSPYKNNTRYQVTVIDRDPDSAIPYEVALLPLCNYDRHYVSDNLHHDVFRIYV